VDQRPNSVYNEKGKNVSENPNARRVSGEGEEKKAFSHGKP